jgi:flagellar biosynthesis/type III secretory pathway chaperone
MLDGGHMTPDERMEKLTERVDSIARNVELLSGMQIESEKRLNRLIETVGRMAEILVTHDERLDDLEGNQSAL